MLGLSVSTKLNPATIKIVTAPKKNKNNRNPMKLNMGYNMK